jgi:predicted Rossmann fold nucleotide-binding protein DprA/Smf involved in DNA uptake
VCSAGDILVALSLTGAAVAVPPDAPARKPAPPAAGPGRDRRVFDALTGDPASLDELARLTGLDLTELCGGLERLAQAGLARGVGGWWERV